MTSLIQSSVQANLHVSLPAPPEVVRRYVGEPQRLLQSGFPPERITQLARDRFRLQVRPLTWMGLSIEPVAELQIGADDQGNAWARLIDYELKGHPWLVSNLKIDFQARLHTASTMQDGRTHMEGLATASARFPTPPFLAWMAEPVLSGAARTILEGFLWILKDRLTRSLDNDFRQWQRAIVQVEA